MNGFFSLDGKFYRFGCFLLDLLMVGFLWTLFSLPIITMGATTTALYYVCTKKHSGQDIYIFMGFLRSFKTNFVKSTIAFIVLALIALLLWVNLHILGQIEMGWLTLPIRFSLWFMIFQVLLTATNAFAILSRFEVTVPTALRYGLFMGYRNFLTTITNWMTLLAIFLLSLFAPMILLFMGGLYVYFSSFAFVRLFRKHSTEFEEHSS